MEYTEGSPNKVTVKEFAICRALREKEISEGALKLIRKDIIKKKFEIAGNIGGQLFGLSQVALSNFVFYKQATNNFGYAVCVGWFLAGSYILCQFYKNTIDTVSDLHSLEDVEVQSEYNLNDATSYYNMVKSELEVLQKYDYNTNQAENGLFAEEIEKTR